MYLKTKFKTSANKNDVSPLSESCVDLYLKIQYYIILQSVTVGELSKTLLR